MPPDNQHLPESNYFRNARTEMLTYVPSGAMRILEVGCGGGVFGAALRERHKQTGQPPAQMTGLELDQNAAAMARKTFDDMLIGDFYEQVQKLPAGAFDCIIGNDVVEHLVDPWRALTLLRNLLKPGGRLVLSLPNVRFWGVVKDLVWEGAWNYADDGILDRTHMRFFTRSSIADLLRKTRFTDVSIEGINSRVSGWKLDMVNALTARRFDDMRYLQFAACATRNTKD